MIAFVNADATRLPLADDSVDLVFGSPPYEDARTYGIDFRLKGQAWVDWMVAVVRESLRVCRGLVAFVVEGRTANFQWTATPALLLTDLHRAGICLRKPPIYKRFGIMGGGGANSQHAAAGGSCDWLRNDWEFVVCATKRASKLPWADGAACGEPPKHRAGGPPSHRKQNGERASRVLNCPSGVGASTGDVVRVRREYKPPAKSNPGNVIDCGAVGGGHLGHATAHENEAPFPLSLADFFVRSFCPPGGLVLDPFSGSGTTMHAAALSGRGGIGIDLRTSQCELGRRRCDGLLPLDAKAVAS